MFDTSTQNEIHADEWFFQTLFCNGLKSVIIFFTFYLTKYLFNFLFKGGHILLVTYKLDEVIEICYVGAHENKQARKKTWQHF